MIPARLLLAIALAAAGAGAAHQYYAPRLALAEQRAGEIERAYISLAAVSQEQAAAVTHLRTEADRRQREAETAAEAARRRAAPHRARAEAILRAPLPPAGADLCAVARQEIDADLAAERGRPASPEPNQEEPRT